jgi:hypothetical protein
VLLLQLGLVATMKNFPIETDEPCELCEVEPAQQATQLVVLDGFRWFGSRVVACDVCKQQLVNGEIELELGDYENCDQ